MSHHIYLSVSNLVLTFIIVPKASKHSAGYYIQNITNLKFKCFRKSFKTHSAGHFKLKRPSFNQNLEMSNSNITSPSTGTTEDPLPNHDSPSVVDLMAEEFLGDAAIPLDDLAFEFVFDHGAGIAVPPSTPVDAGDLDALEDNFMVDSHADEEYDPGDLPPGFPMQLGRLIRFIPHDKSRCQRYRKFAVGLITLPYGSGSPENIQLLQQLAALLAQAPPLIIGDIEEMITELVLACMRTREDRDFQLNEFMQVHPASSGRRIMRWLIELSDQVLEDIFGMPITGTNLSHLLHHTWITLKKGPQVKVSITLETCEHSGYTPKASAKTVQHFIDSLPDVPLESLAEDDRNCGICRGAYNQDPSLLNGLPETVMRLPCGHVFGELCLTVLLSPKPEGWEHRLCPLCRALVPVLPKTPLGDFLQTGRVLAVVE